MSYFYSFTNPVVYFQDKSVQEPFDVRHMSLTVYDISINPLTTVPEISRAGAYGQCVL